MFNYIVEPMPENQKEVYGDNSGLYRVVRLDLGSGSMIPKYPPRKIYRENLTYEIADAEADRLNIQEEQNNT